MDKEVLDAIHANLSEVIDSLEGAINELDTDTINSPSTGKTIALDFDDTDLTNIQVAVDVSAAQLNSLSAEIANLLMG